MSFHAPYTQPTSNPIEWDDIKYWLRLDDDAERASLLALAGDALAWAEGYTGSTLVSRTRTVTHYAADDELQVPYGPVVSIASVLDSTSTAVPYTLYRAGSYTGVKLSTSKYPVSITFTAGYSPLPDPVRRAVLMAVEAMYYNRQAPDLTGAQNVLKLWSQNPWTA